VPSSRLVWRDRALRASNTIHDTPHHLTEHAGAASSLLHIAQSRPKLHASDTIHDAPHHWCILHDGQIKALHDSGILGDMGMRPPPTLPLPHVSISITGRMCNTTRPPSQRPPAGVLRLVCGLGWTGRWTWRQRSRRRGSPPSSQG
jgi:hypothetical protein